MKWAILALAWPSMEGRVLVMRSNGRSERVSLCFAAARINVIAPGTKCVKSNDVIFRSVIFAAVAGVSLLFFTIVLRIPSSVSRVSSGVSYPQIGVSLFWQRDAVIVRVDNREERVPHSQLATSAIYQEAVSRIPSGERPADTTIRWSRVLRYWLPLTGLAWWILFRLWQPPRPYIEGGRV